MIMNDKVQDLVETEIYNFIDFFTSDDKEREDMKIVAYNYMKEEFNYIPERINVLEERAWLKGMTGEDIMNNLSKQEAEEYSKLMYGDK